MSAFRIRRGIGALLVTAAGVALAATGLATPTYAADPLKVRITPIQGGNAMSVSGTLVRDVFQFDSNGGTVATVTVSASTGTVSNLAGSACVQNTPSQVTCFGVSFIETFGGAGNDEIRNITGVRMGVNGGSGDDLLIGGDFRDTLNGGLGIDTANGRGGQDTCSAETVISCEEVTS